jgi:hypothetical protein
LSSDRGRPRSQRRMRARELAGCRHTWNASGFRPRLFLLIDWAT